MPLVVSPSALLSVLAGALACVALLSAATRAVAIATGRDFVFGLIPAFDPAGSRNLIAWVSSMLLGVSAVLMQLASHCCAARRGRACGERVVAGALAVCSLSSMTAVAGLLPTALGTFAPPRGVLVGSVVAAAAVALLIRRPSSRAEMGLVWTGLSLVVVSQFGPGSAATPAAAMLALGSRIALWSGAVLLLVAAARLVFERQPLVVQVVEGGGWPLRARQNGGPCEVTLDPDAVTRWAAWTIGLLASLSLVLAWPAPRSEAAEGWYRFFFVDFEGNAPSWFSAVLLLWCGLVAAGIAAATRARQADWRLWAVVGLGFAALSADEAASFHELLVEPLRALVGGSPWLRYPLVLPGTVAVVVAAAVLGGFVRRLPGGTRRALLTGGVVFVVGALGLETVSGWYDPELHGASITYVWLATVEEVCEMAGVAIVLRGLLRHLGHHLGVLEVQTPRSSAAAAATS